MDFKIIKGSLPILLSAPHAKPQIRPGFTLKNPKPREVNTDSIVTTLCQKTTAFGIYATKTQRVDPNWYKNSLYKKVIKKLVEKNKIKFVLDVHGASAERPFAVEYDDFRRSKVIKRIEENLQRCLKKFGFSEGEIVRGLLHKNKQWTITEFCIDKLEIPALQLEINRKIRTPQSPRLSSLLSALTCFIKSL